MIPHFSAFERGLFGQTKNTPHDGCLLLNKDLHRTKVWAPHAPPATLPSSSSIFRMHSASQHKLQAAVSEAPCCYLLPNCGLLLARSQVDPCRRRQGWRPPQRTGDSQTEASLPWVQGCSTATCEGGSRVVWTSETLSRSKGWSSYTCECRTTL